MQQNKQLKNAGLKVTMPRLKILQILEQHSEHHLSAEEVYKKLLQMGEDVSLATVYRVLTQFEAAGLISKHNFASDHSVFELSPEQHHDHLVCIKCRKIDEFVDDTIEERQNLIAAKFGYQITDHVLNIYGICQSCQKNT